MFWRNALAFPVVLLALTTACVPSGSLRGEFQRTLQVSGPVDLQVLTRSGDITVRSGPVGSVLISARIHGASGFFIGPHATSQQIRAIEQNPPIRQTGNMIKIDYPSVRQVSIDYDIVVPADTGLRAETGSGNQDISGLTHYADVRTGSGNVELNNMPGGAHVETGSGNISGASVGAIFEARTGSGDVRVRLVGTGNVQAHTGSGNIELHDLSGGLSVNTGSGDITADGRPSAEWNVGTSSGNVRLRVPSDAAFDLDVSTGSGEVTVDHPVNTTVQGRVQSGSSRHVTGKVNAGGVPVKVHTGSGDVHID